MLSCVTRYSAFWWQVWLVPAVVTMISPHHLIHLSILFLHRWRMYVDLAWFGSKLLFFFFISFSFFLD
jgi:hypothetical protein